MKALRNLDGSFVVNGEVHRTVGALERALGFPKNALRSRLDAGWDLDRAVTVPVDRSVSIRARQGLGKPRGGAPRRSNVEAAASVPENATSQAIREHLAKPRDAFGDPRLWWVNLGLLYAALRAQSFTTPAGTTRPGFHDWLRARGLMPFSPATAQAAIRMASNVDAVRRTPAWRAGKTHPTDLVRDLAGGR